MLKLVDQNGQTLTQVEEGDWFVLPNGDRTSPAYVGWDNGDYRLEAIPTPSPPAPEEALAEQRAAMRLSFAQLLIGLVTEGWITEAEGRAWLKRELPTAVVSLINSLPSQQQFAATARASDPSYVLRTDPLVVSMATAQGKSATEVDTFFTTYANV